MQIRKATENDLNVMMEIYAHARKFMAETGNPTQWADSYPAKELIRQDIAQGVSYVCVEDQLEEDVPEAKENVTEQEIEAVFMYDMREDPTYAVIENGNWVNDRPYGVLHRIASRGRKKGVASFCMQWCFEQCGNLKCDTHEDNKVMQHVMEKNGFVRCGRIYVEDGSPRVAFQKTE
ncbi:MAG: GNAT family N-acetyltransferase [Lachnospiraceae bacterium]|nr:GNAT family N-acetyltransferase [Lachnospiraceae bacterium]